MQARLLVVARILAGVVAVAGGAVAIASATQMDIFLGYGRALFTMALIGVVVGLVCGVLGRSWWALVAVVVLFDLGQAATTILLDYAFQGQVPDYRPHLASAIVGLVLFPVFYFPFTYLSLVVGTAIGTAFGKRMEKQ